MLVLERHVDDDILIGNDIVVKVVSIRGKTVKLGIQAPSGVAVDRREVREDKDTNGIRKLNGVNNNGKDNR